TRHPSTACRSGLNVDPLSVRVVICKELHTLLLRSRPWHQKFRVWPVTEKRALRLLRYMKLHACDGFVVRVRSREHDLDDCPPVQSWRLPPRHASRQSAFGRVGPGHCFVRLFDLSVAGAGEG